jgi:hypothetical protein
LYFIYSLKKKNRRDFESLRVFDGNKFVVWMYDMKICFEEKDIMPIVNDAVPKSPNNPSDAEKVAWQKTNTQA